MSRPNAAATRSQGPPAELHDRRPYFSLGASLQDLPAELLLFIYEHSTARVLALWALSNGKWAQLIIPALPALWHPKEK